MLPTYLLTSLRMGWVPAEALVDWADRRIADAARTEPESWIIGISLSGADRFEIDRVLREHGAPVEIDDQMFLALLSDRFFRGNLALENACSDLYNRFCSVDWKERTPLIQDIYCLDDELEWNGEQARKRCVEILKPYRDAGAAMMREMEEVLEK